MNSCCLVFVYLLRCMIASRGFKDMEDLNSLLRVIETDLATVEQKLASHRAAHPSPAKLMVRVCVELYFLLKYCLVILVRVYFIASLLIPSTYRAIVLCTYVLCLFPRLKLLLFGFR